MNAKNSLPRIAYVVSRFPHLPETFILREMEKMAALGWPISLYPIVTQHQTVVHTDAIPWMARAKRMPLISLPIFAENARCAIRPQSRYLNVLRQVIWENRSSANFLLRAMALFPKAVWAAQAMEQESVAHIHAHFATHPALFAWITHRLTGISYSVTVHAHDIFVCRSMLATKLREAAFIAAISTFNRNFLAEKMGDWVLKKTDVIRCGIDPAQYLPRRKQTPPSGRFAILNIGSLQPYKGQRHLIEACRLLRERGVPFECRIIGEGTLRPGLERQIQKNGLANVIFLEGAKKQDQVAQMLSEADCYAQPSVITASGKMEGIPVALMEALACEVPVVTSSLSGIPELVLQGKTGYLVPPADPSALAQAIECVYREPSQATGFAKAGRVLVEQQFNLDTNVRQLSARILQTIQESPSNYFS
jgi:colanic acid/amylovoran biosynthesis glycosyltransferase